MSKTHKITRLKKRIAELEKRLEKFNTLDRRIKFEKHEIVELKSVIQVPEFLLCPDLSKEALLCKVLNEMFDIQEHPEIKQLFKLTDYVNRKDPLEPMSVVHYYEVRCLIVKPEE